MALSTYDELATSIQTWLAETSAEVNLAATIPDFVLMLEAELNEDPDFRILDMGLVETADLDKDDPYVTLPDDYLEMVYVTATNEPDRPALTYKAPQDLVSQTNNLGYLSDYTIVGGQLRTYPLPGEGAQLEMGFYGKIPGLQANSTNWLLQKSPQIYLFGSLRYAEPFLDNDPRVATWETFFQTARVKLIEASKDAESSGGAMAVGLHERVA